MDITETTLDSQQLLSFPPYALVRDTVRLPDGRAAQRTYMKHPGGVAVLALGDDGRISFVRQVRHPIGQETLELPAGKLESSDAGAKSVAARRELLEETGLSCDRIVELGSIHPSPAIVDEVITLFFATRLHSGHQDLDDDEFINAQWLSVAQVREKIRTGEITDAKTICAFAMAAIDGYI